jgi:hypothetical protein
MALLMVAEVVSHSFVRWYCNRNPPLVHSMREAAFKLLEAKFGSLFTDERDRTRSRTGNRRLNQFTC